MARLGFDVHVSDIHFGQERGSEVYVRPFGILARDLGSPFSSLLGRVFRLSKAKEIYEINR